MRRSVTTYAGQTIVRYKALTVLGWTVALHAVHAPGSGSWHTHYWDSWSLCLLGGLAEAVDGGVRTVRPGTLRFRPCAQAHRVRGFAVTLVLTSPRRHRASIWIDGRRSDPLPVGREPQPL